MLQVRRWNLQNCKTSFYANMGHPLLHSLWQRIEDGCPSFRSNEQATGTVYDCGAAAVNVRWPVGRYRAQRAARTDTP